MRKDGTYGGNMELVAFAQLYEVDIKVYQPGTIYVIEGKENDNMNEEKENDNMNEEKENDNVNEGKENDNVNDDESTNKIRTRRTLHIM
jgi:hypothetical protein